MAVAVKKPWDLTCEHQHTGEETRLKEGINICGTDGESTQRSWHNQIRCTQMGGRGSRKGSGMDRGQLLQNKTGNQGTKHKEVIKDITASKT